MTLMEIVQSELHNAFAFAFGQNCTYGETQLCFVFFLEWGVKWQKCYMTYISRIFTNSILKQENCTSSSGTFKPQGSGCVLSVVAFGCESHVQERAPLCTTLMRTMVFQFFLTSGHQGEQKHQKENVTFHSLSTFKDSECKRETKCLCGVVSHYAPKYKYMYQQVHKVQQEPICTLQWLCFFFVSDFA